jgi:hypothetical protein
VPATPRWARLPAAGRGCRARSWRRRRARQACPTRARPRQRCPMRTPTPAARRCYERPAHSSTGPDAPVFQRVVVKIHGTSFPTGRHADRHAAGHTRHSHHASFRATRSRSVPNAFRTEADRRAGRHSSWSRASCARLPCLDRASAAPGPCPQRPSIVPAAQKGGTHHIVRTEMDKSFSPLRHPNRNCQIRVSR